MIDKKYKEGFVREDGKVFWRYQQGRGEIWITPEQYESRKKSRKEYRRKCIAEYRRSAINRDIDNMVYYGKYCQHKNAYFIGLSSSGKDMWVTEEKFLRHRLRLRNRNKTYREKVSKYPKSNLKFGDQHPENPELFVRYFIGNKPFFGTAQELAETKKSRSISYRKRFEKYKEIRRQKLLALTNKLKRGTFSIERNAYFWNYDIKGDEVWLRKDVFDRKHQQEKAKRNLNRAKKRANHNVNS
jgi:hypothetical protein